MTDTAASREEDLGGSLRCEALPGLADLQRRRRKVKSGFFCRCREHSRGTVDEVV